MTEGIPLEMFPPWVRDYVLAVSAKLEIDPSAVATLALGALSHACMGRYEVQVRDGWVEPVTLYVGYVAKSGEKKSAAHRDIWGHLERVAREQTVRVQKERRAAMGEQAALDKAVKAAAKELAETSKEYEKAAARQQYKNAIDALDACQVPPLPVPILDDTTPEALAVAMVDSLGCATIASPEGHGFFLRAAGLYSKGEASQDLYLKGHAAESVRVTRIGRAPLYLKSALLTVCICMQPSVLVGLGNKDFRGTGFLARFLICIPPSRVGHRKDNGPNIPHEVNSAYVYGIQALADVPTTEELQRLKFSAGARDVIHRFNLELEPRLIGDLQPVVDWANKLAGAAARIAAIFHVADRAKELGPCVDEIDTKCAVRGVEVARSFIPHALAAFSQITGGQPRAVREDFEARLRTRFAAAERFTKREILRAFRDVSAKEADALLEHLTEVGAIVEGVRIAKTRQFRFPPQPVAAASDNAEAAE